MRGSEQIIDCPIKYPFNLEEITFQAPSNCTKNALTVEQNLPKNFSAQAHLFVAIAILSALYSLAALLCYLFTCQNPQLGVVDFAFSEILCLLWMISTKIYALAFSDIKHYANPDYLKDKILFCRDRNAVCDPVYPGNWSYFNTILVRI